MQGDNDHKNYDMTNKTEYLPLETPTLHAINMSTERERERAVSESKPPTQTIHKIPVARLASSPPTVRSHLPAAVHDQSHQHKVVIHTIRPLKPIQSCKHFFAYFPNQGNTAHDKSNIYHYYEVILAPKITEQFYFITCRAPPAHLPSS